MQNFHQLNAFLRFFIIFGHTTNSPPKSKKSLFTTISVRKILYIIFVLFAMYLVCYRLKFWSIQRGISFITTRMFLVLLILIIALYVDTVYPTSSNVIYTNIGTMFKYIEREFKTTISMQSLVRESHRKVLATYVIQVILFLTTITLEMDSMKTYTNIIAGVYFAYRDWMVLYFVMFIDFFTLLLYSVNEAVARAILQHPSTDGKLQVMHKIKWIYFHLWKIVNIYNER